MKHIAYAALLFSIATAGCSSQSGNANAENPAEKPNEAVPLKPSEGGQAEVALSPENTTIQFVGNHTGDDPKPRTGTFTKFDGKVGLKDGKLSSIVVDIETGSLKTDIEKLTNHLKSPDFFDVRQHPKAKFQSTAIKTDAEGKVKITGDLTLLGKTKPVSFPATVSTKEDFSLKAEFKIDRTQFGMDYGLEGVEKDVEMTVTVGK